MLWHFRGFLRLARDPVKVHTSRTLTRKNLQTYAEARLGYPVRSTLLGVVVQRSPWVGASVRPTRNGVIVESTFPSLLGVVGFLAMAFSVVGLLYWIAILKPEQDEFASEIHERIDLDLGV